MFDFLRRTHKAHAPDHSDAALVHAFVDLPTHWELSLCPRDQRSVRHLPLFRHANTLSFRAHLDRMICLGDRVVLKPEDRMHMRALLDVHHRVSGAIVQKRLPLLVPDYLEQLTDPETRMSLHELLRSDDPEQFHAGYHATRRMFP